MISVTSPEQTDESTMLTAPGGFSWWYADLLDERGSGLVVIWGFGIPFVPGYTSAARRGVAPRPLERPSLNVAAYRHGRPALYLLQEYPSDLASWSLVAGTWRFGDSVIRSGERDGRRWVRADLDCPVPGSKDRLTGQVKVEGVVRRPAASRRASESPHLWTPLLGPARGTAELGFGDTVMSISGPAYHDRNASSAPLSALGIRRWMWGRTLRGDTLIVWYALWPEGDGAPPRLEVLSVDAAGATTHLEEVELVLGAPLRGWLGMPRWRTGALLRAGRPWLDLAFGAPVDDGPFYVRQQVAVRGSDGDTSVGWSEVCVPGRVDLAVHRPLVSMAHHRVDGTNSWWLPLFSGPRTGRVGRLTRWWAERGARPTKAVLP